MRRRKVEGLTAVLPPPTQTWWEGRDESFVGQMRAVFAIPETLTHVVIFRMINHTFSVAIFDFDEGKLVFGITIADLPEGEMSVNPFYALPLGSAEPAGLNLDDFEGQRVIDAVELLCRRHVDITELTKR